MKFNYLYFILISFTLLFTSCKNIKNATISEDKEKTSITNKHSSVLQSADVEKRIEKENKMETATLGNGCFWCSEAIFEGLKGVTRVESGYSGGEVKNPTYKAVCEGITGHAEVIQIDFDANQISFAEILEVFFATHDPTTLNRQGNDVGTQYRSAIFYHSPEQKVIAEKAIQAGNESKVWRNPIVTEITKFETFYSAGDYHQDYYNRVGSENSYCSLVITPKVDKFKKLFKDKLK